MLNRKLPHLSDDTICTGCSACVNACNTGALVIGVNKEGFYRPILDADKCIGCLLCQKSCPLVSKSNMIKSNNTTPSNVWAAWHKDHAVRKASSSGGAFSAMASNILKYGGIVVGAAYDNDLKVCHICIDSEEQLASLRQSKYVQSNMGACMKEVRKNLEAGRRVMFVGTPCQCGGVRSFLGKDYENLLLVDFVYHGVPSPMMYEKWKHWLEKQYGEIQNIEFRNKCKGWYDALRVVTLKNGLKIKIKGKWDSYWVGFNNKNNNLQYSCYDCQFLGLPRQTDVTIADFWKIGHHAKFGHRNEIERGISLVIANNPRAVTFIENCRDLEIHERTIEEAVLGNQATLHSCNKPESRETLYIDLQRLSFDDFVNDYLTPDIKNMLVKIWREYLPLWFIRKIRTLKQK